MRFLSQHLDLQAKISLVLVAVILPTFLIVTIAQNKLTQPILEEEVRQMGIHFGKTIAAEIDSSRLLSAANATQAIENLLQEKLYSQPDIIRIDIMARASPNGAIKVVASNIEEDPGAPLSTLSLVDVVSSEYKTEEKGAGFWDIYVPIEHRSRDARSKKLLGMIHLVVSTKLVGRIVGTLWKSTAMAAALSVVTLILVLSYFLRKTIANDRLLKEAESANLQLIERLHNAHRQLMITEKLAVMGQLTASFAHEIGTPLTAIGGHLQLLQDEIPSTAKEALGPRFDIVNGQLSKIEGIVKGFLQSTAKPSSQKQLVDLNRLVDKTVGIVIPRTDSLGVEIKRQFDHQIAPVRAVPLDLEQVLLNLLNNSIDSIQAKMKTREKGHYHLEITTELSKGEGKQWARIIVYDTGEGIRKVDLKNVLKPFFTTKRPGEGTGLGLTICQELVHKYGGELLIDSKEGAWTRVTLQLPYHAMA
jgi:signal transduction histidine kinase